MLITPLDKWIKEKTDGDLAAYQLKKVNETLRIAQSGSYYRKAHKQKCLESLSELRLLPTINAVTLMENGIGLVCVPQDEISRIVTLTTSGSTGAHKRVYFTEEDQELTIDYFANGLQTVVPPDGIMAILLPCERSGGVGNLIAQGLDRIPVKSVQHGLVSELASCAKMLQDSGANTIVGIPVQVLAVARYCEAAGIKTDIRGVLLSTDNIPRVVRRELVRIWDCEVYEHYGMTEMGLGGAIDCDAHDGYHIRENDLLFEILDENGNQLADGEWGEIVFTTLSRRGMPLVRYRTGDISRIIPGRCDCGSALKRIAPIAGRIGADVKMASGGEVRMREFDEVLFAVPCISDFWITASPKDNFLKIEIDMQEIFGEPPSDEIGKLLRDSGLTDGLKTEINVVRRPGALTGRAGKRTITMI